MYLFQGLFTGIFRGCGRQTWGSIASIMFFISTFGIGIPLMFLTDLGLGGKFLTLKASTHAILIFTHLKLCLATATHNCKWVKITHIYLI